MEIFRVFSFLLLVSSPFLHVVRCQVDPDGGDISDLVKGGDLGIVGNQFGSRTPNIAPGVHTVCVFPKNMARLVPAGEETELIVGVHNDGDSTLNVISIGSSLHVPFDHRMLVQNLTTQYYGAAPVRNAAQASFPYIFAGSKYLQPGSYDLVGAIIYEIDEQPYRSFFYNGTIEVVEAGGVFNMESVLLVTLGAAVIGFFGLWAYGQLQQLSKKNKSASKVEVGTRAIDPNLDEWLQGTAYTQPLPSNKSKKKK